MATPLLSPRNGQPALIESVSDFEVALEEIDLGEGPIAIDAERASGFRYFPKAYLIQIFRRNSRIFLIDPISIGSTNLWDEMNSAFSSQEWVIHASTQDLPCMRELGLKPRLIFDTELGGRIAGCEKVGLGPLCETLLEIQLAKEHSAVDWSQRPLRPEWLNYAALDVDVLLDLRDSVENLLKENGKLEIAQSEFAHILTLDLQPERIEPWRRTSGMHRIRNRKDLALVRKLWELRNQFAKSVDIAPGRVFNDETLIAIVTKEPSSAEEFAKILAKRSRFQELPTESWYQEFLSAKHLPESELPQMRGSGIGLPAIRMWQAKNPLGYARATHVRAQISQIATELKIPSENLISPEIVRKLCWQDPPQAQNDVASYIAQTLSASGARHWQISAIANRLVEPIMQTTPLIVEAAEDEIGITQQ